MKIDDEIKKMCDQAKTQALKDAKRMIKFWESPQGQDSVEDELKELCRVAIVRQIFLNHPWWWIYNKKKMKFKVWIFKIGMKLLRLFKIRKRTGKGPGE
jgi:hypothetical protein